MYTLFYRIIFISFKLQDIDYIIWTGDIPPHDLWNQDRNVSLSSLKQTVGKIAKAFPKKPVFPALGNHESAPANM